MGRDRLEKVIARPGHAEHHGFVGWIGALGGQNLLGKVQAQSRQLQSGVHHTGERAPAQERVERGGFSGVIRERDMRVVGEGRARVRLCELLSRADRRGLRLCETDRTRNACTEDHAGRSELVRLSRSWRTV